MKRGLLQNVKVQPYSSGDAVERAGFLSAVLGAKVGTAGDLTVTVTHSDDGTASEAMEDERLFPNETRTKDDAAGAVTLKGLEAGDIVDIDIDLIGCKNTVKVTVSGTAAKDTELAIALGDSSAQPV